MDEEKKDQNEPIEQSEALQSLESSQSPEEGGAENLAEGIGKKGKSKKSKKPEFVDDGRTIADMDYEHITGYKSKEERKKHQEIRSLNLSKEERHAIYKAGFAQFMPMFACFLLGFGIVVLLLYFFWLN